MCLLWLSSKYEFHWYRQKLKFYPSIVPPFAKAEHNLACSVQVKENTNDFIPVSSDHLGKWNKPSRWFFKKKLDILKLYRFSNAIYF